MSVARHRRERFKMIVLIFVISLLIIAICCVLEYLLTAKITEMNEARERDKIVEGKITTIQNQPRRPKRLKDEHIGGPDDIWKDPTIVICVGDEEWDEAYKRWLDGKAPTDDPRWKCGVVAF